MKKDKTPRKRLLTGSDHPLLNVKEVMDAILEEAEGLPTDVRQILVQARDASWKAFVESQQKINDSVQ